MDALARSRRALLSRGSPSTANAARAIAIGAAIAGAIVSCAGNKGAPVGLSNQAQHPPLPILATADGGADAGPVLTGSLSDYKTQMLKLTTARVPSIGHAGGRWDIDVWCNESAQRALTAKSPAEEGAACVVEHWERSSLALRGPLMAMQKEHAGDGGDAGVHGGWRYVVVGAGGATVADGTPPQCADCHDEAPVDHLFAIGAH